MQLVVIAVAAGLLVLAAVIFFVVRSDGGSSPSPKKSVSANVKLTLGGIQNANAGAPATLGDDAANQIMAGVGQYVDKGLIAPIKTGKPPTDVAGLFDAGTQTAIQGPDKNVLFENGQPKLTGDFKPAADPVIITALSDGNGQFVLATAAFTYHADEGVAGGTLNTSRTIGLTFTPDNGWKVTGYDVTLTRQGAQVEGSTTTTAKK
jgi:opacity protein-like surface antigen